MWLCVIGTGYVGLVAGVCFADKGYDVFCVDIDEKKIASLQQGNIPIYEPGLKEMCERAVKRDHLTFTTNVELAVRQSKIIFICVGTPEGQDGEPNMSAVWAVGRTIGKALSPSSSSSTTPSSDSSTNDSSSSSSTLISSSTSSSSSSTTTTTKEPSEDSSSFFRVVATKSTVPVGTGDRLEEILREQGALNVSVVSNPEFLKEGDAINDFVKPDRIIIGSNDEKAAELMEEVYSPFTRRSERFLKMDRRSAELTKYAANCMLALRITFMNQVAALCETVGADVSSIRKGIGMDQRIGSAFLFPGPGYGGSCFPKDVKAMLRLGRQFNSPQTIMETVDTFNQEQKLLLAQKVKKHLGDDLSGKNIGIWGLSFKPETDDVRESPSIYVINDLLKANATLKAYDPEAVENFRRVVDDHMDLTFCVSMYDAAKAAHCLVIVTDWNEFKMPNFDKLKSIMKTPLIIDGRNLYPLKNMKNLGFTYEGIGRKPK